MDKKEINEIGDLLVKKIMVNATIRSIRTLQAIGVDYNDAITITKDNLEAMKTGVAVSDKTVAETEEALKKVH